MSSDKSHKGQGRSGESELLIYQTDDGATRLEVHLENETVWLTQNQMAELFQTTKQNVSLHIQNIFEERELNRSSTVKESLTVRMEGAREVKRAVEYYNLDVIISVGYRVKSQRGTQFRQWATQRLREHIVKGFTLDDRLASGPGFSRGQAEYLGGVRTAHDSPKWRLEEPSLDDRFKRMGGGRYFDELLARIREFRSFGHLCGEMAG